MNPTLVQARFDGPIAPIEVTEGKPLPTEIQWMPPGIHKIQPHVNGQPKKMTVRVEEALARKFQAQLEEMRQVAASGEGDWPYIDANHEDGAAMGEVTALRWAGDHPKEGGIRVAVTWTKPGREALEGRAFRRFSPQWLLHPETGEPVGIGVNMGGLVNRAAFERIQPVIAKQSDSTTEPAMTEAEKSELQQLIISATKPLVDRVTALEAKASAAGPDLKPLTDRLAALETGRQEGALAAARGRVQALVAEGRLAPQDKDGHEALAKAIVADPAVESTLAKLPVNPAFKTVTGAAGGGGPAAPESFPKAVEVALAGGAKTKSEALDLAMAKHPDLYRDWVKTGGKL